jgi:glucose/arabinose dehydrogenase
VAIGSLAAMRHRPTLFALVAALVLLGGACSDDDDGGSAAPTTTRPAGGTTTSSATSGSAQPQPLADVKLTLTRVAQLDQPVALALRRGDNALYFVEKPGRITALRDGEIDETPTLDITDLVKNGGEQGFLGAAFSPDGSKVYVHYTDRDGDARIAEYAMDGDRADTSTRRELLYLDDPYPNHNGGNLLFGPDGMLWIGMGDAGAGGDPMDNAQSLGTLFGKMWRIDPTPSGGRPYTIPPDNPFIDEDGARPEIWAYGLRNPWRYSFDRATGDLWIGDVGQNAWEEIDFVAAGSTGGENFGWARVEGNHEFKGAAPPGAIDPIHEYRNGDEGCSVTGGFVYRGSRIPGLTGAYLFSDYCSSTVMGLRQADGERTELEDLGLELGSIVSFGEDADGELYVLSLDGEIARIDPA